MTILMLDAAFPPNPQQWVADMNAVGAGGGFVYVWGGFVNYSAAHVTAARSAGKTVLPIVVPGNVPQDVQPMLAAAQGYGFQPGPIAFDLESGSQPPRMWVDSAFSVARALGWMPEEYGTASVLGTYTPINEDWIAQWIRTGVLSPIPVLPTGWQAWQFVNDVVVNGNQYDASVVSDAFVGSVLAHGVGGGSMIAKHPSQQRADIFWSGPSGVQWRFYNGVHGTPTPGTPWLLDGVGSTNLGGNPVGEPSACWINDQYLHVVIVDRTTGTLMVKELGPGGWEPNWNAVHDGVGPDLARVSGPPGPPGKDGAQGPPGPATLAAHHHATGGAVAD